MAAGPNVSVIIVNYRSYDELTVCLTAALSEADTLSLEAVVIDQQGDRRATTIQQRFPSATLISNAQNTGFAAGVNLGASHAVGPLLLVLNPDTRKRCRASEHAGRALVVELRKNA